MDAGTPQKSRRVDLDAWRGLAILAMIGDHVAVFILTVLPENPAQSLLWDSAYMFRFTIGRIALPVFMIVSGMLIERYGFTWKRYLQVVIAAIIVNFLWIAAPFGATPPDILLLWALIVPFSFLWKKYPILFGVLGFIQLTNWQISWGGYQPGEILLLLCLGVLAQKTNFTFPSLKDFDQPMAWIGRRPLIFYVGHIVLLSIVSIFIVDFLDM